MPEQEAGALTMMLDWEGALTDRCCRLQVVISFIIMKMSEDQRSDIKRKAGSGSGK